MTPIEMHPNTKPGYKFLSHTTDAYIQATGSSMEQAFEYAGQALFDTFCELKSITPTISDTIEFQGSDEVNLLYDWLEKTFLKFELDGMVYAKFQLEPIIVKGTTLYGKATAIGEKYDKHKHGAKVEVKAVTYHRMAIKRDENVTVLTFILDL